jgi:hypothetical protein
MHLYFLLTKKVKQVNAQKTLKRIYMKPPLANIAFFVGIVSLSACQQQYKQQLEYAAVDTLAIKAAVDSLGAVVQKAHDTKDDKLLASTWAKDGILSIAGSPPVRGRDAIISAISSMPLPPGGEMEIHPIEIQVLSREWAYVLGVDTLTYIPSGSTEPIKETFTFFVLVRKTPEGWQTYREMLSPNQVPKNRQKQ